MQLTQEVLARTVAAVEAEGRALRDEFLRPQGPRGSGHKAPVDNEIEARLCRALQSLVPCTFIGEETGATPGTLAGWRWLVDPHDGTSDFLKGYRGSAVSVALLRGREPVLGVVCSPMSPDRGFDTIAWAEGCGPVRRNGEAVARTLESGCLQSGEFVWASQSAASRPALYARAAAPARFIAMPSIAYRLARVAAGDGVVAISTHNVEEYDVAAGAALIRGAGGVVLDAGGGPMAFSAEGCATVSGCVAGSPEAARAVAKLRWDGLDAAPKLEPRCSRAFPKCTDADQLSRAQAAFLGLFAGREELDGAAEAALVLARSLAQERRLDTKKLTEAVAAWRASRPPPSGPDAARVLAVPLRLFAHEEVERARGLARDAAPLFGLSPGDLEAAVTTGASPPAFPAPAAVHALMACRAIAEAGARQVRPPEVWPDDALDLAEALLRAGASASRP